MIPLYGVAYCELNLVPLPTNKHLRTVCSSYAFDALYTSILESSHKLTDFLLCSSIDINKCSHTVLATLLFCKFTDFLLCNFVDTNKCCRVDRVPVSSILESKVLPKA